MRCAWPGRDPLYVAYHDEEWGRPVRGDTALFERLVLESFQSGLSWLIVLRKRPAFREAFVGFDPADVAAMGEADVTRLLADPGIIRNRRKIQAAVGNARALLAWQEAAGPQALTDAFWAHAPVARRRPEAPTDIASQTPESRDLARLLKARGFTFLGPTTLHAGMQACGLVDDHLAGCSVAPSADEA